MNKTILLLMGLMLFTGFSGCAGIRESWSPFSETEDWDPLNKKTDEEEPVFEEGFGRPVSMAAIWKASVYEQPGIMPVRGFGGRFFFYDENNDPIKASGDLIIYGFDDAIDDGGSGSAPKKKFVFRETELQSHFSDSGLGASYSVWVPWEKVGDFRKTITLIPIFRLTDGTIIRCDQSINLLPGKPLEAETANKDTSRPFKVLGSSSAVVNQASHRPGVDGQLSKTDSFDANGNQLTDLQLKTSTIKVTKNLARRMAVAGPGRSPDRISGFPSQEMKSDGRSSSDPRTHASEIKRGFEGGVQAEAGGNRVDGKNLPVKPKRWAYGAPGPFN